MVHGSPKRHMRSIVSLLLISTALPMKHRLTCSFGLGNIFFLFLPGNYFITRQISDSSK